MKSANRRETVSHVFVDYIPEEMENGVVYVSLLYEIAVHRCCCGCGENVVTPIGDTGWTLTSDDQSITLHPSIGNFNQPRRSHYWIQRDRVVWC
ncbi:MAG: DUF6527 family protein [Candidatus Kapaibacterium sp.]